MNKQQALEKIKELENYIKELDSKPKRFKPKKGEEYYCIDNYPIVLCTSYEEWVRDRLMYLSGGVFETEQDAQCNKEKYLRKLEILEWMEDNRKEFEYGKPNYFTAWDYEYNKPSKMNFHFMQNNKYCFTEKKAQQCIDKFGQDLKLIFE